MLTFSFDSSVFRLSSAEMMIFLAAAAKNAFHSREDFIKSALDRHFCDNKKWADKIKGDLSLKPAKEEDIKGFLLGYTELMKPKVVIDYDKIKNVMEIYPNEWNDVYFFFESEGMYFYYNWSTTA